MKGEDLAGKTFGYWAVIEPAKLNCSLYFRCRCKCGTERNVYSASLRNGVSKSCGCKNRQDLIKANTKHGMHGKTLYAIWKGMRQRCNDPNCKAFKNYGGRGITICVEWNDFKSFHEWGVNNGYTKGLEIDRINVNGNYEPSNCRFIPKSEQ